jgi:pimeloyl-ACP methyl ester carboxylesterase
LNFQVAGALNLFISLFLSSKKTESMEKYESNVYKSMRGRHLLHSLYRKHLMAMDVPVAERMVETGFGDTHVMLYGNPGGKPVLAFYGEYAINPLAVRPFTQGLDLNKIRLIVPDPVGHIGFSAEKKLPASKHSYGKWACQVMDGLGFQNMPILGYSFGGSMALQLCAASLLRVERLLLVMPSGILSTPAAKTARLIRPAAGKAAAITDEAVRKALNPVLPFRHDDLVTAAEMIFLHAGIKKKRTGKVGRKVFQKLNVPVYIVAEKSDYLFPGESVIRRAKKIFPHIRGTRLLSLGSHCGLFNDGEIQEESFAAMTGFLLPDATF